MVAVVLVSAGVLRALRILVVTAFEHGVTTLGMTSVYLNPMWILLHFGIHKLRAVRRLSLLLSDCST